MPRTTAALLERALQIVDQVGAGQTPSAEDQDKALNVLTALLAELRTRNILELYVYPADLNSEDIPDDVFNPLADTLALFLRPEFAGGAITRAEREDKFNIIRAVTANPPTYETMQAEFF
jgi:hypothetical protein